jgi:hypothetical protein
MAKSAYETSISNAVSAREITAIKDTFKIEIGNVKDQINKDVSELKQQITALMNNQYTKTEALNLATRLENLEIRLRENEDKLSKGGGPADPWFSTMQSIQNQLTGLSVDVNKIKADVESIKPKK